MFPSFGRPPFRVATTPPRPVRRVPTHVDARSRRARRSCSQTATGLPRRRAQRSSRGTRSGVPQPAACAPRWRAEQCRREFDRRLLRGRSARRGTRTSAEPRTAPSTEIVRKTVVVGRVQRRRAGASRSASSLRERIPSFRYARVRFASTARTLMNSSAAISPLRRPDAARSATRCSFPPATWST